MEDPFLQIVIIFGLILLNGLFAMSEIAVLSSRKARLRQASDSGNERARAALSLATDPGSFLATIQIGITLVGILAGAFGQATLAQALTTSLARFPFLAPYAGILAIGVVVISVTYLSLVIGDLVTKSSA